MTRMNFRSLLFRNALWLLLGQGLRLIFQAFYFVEIARSLGPARYGAFVGAVALAAIAVPFADLGSGNLLIKNVSRDHAAFPAYWGRALASVTGSAGILTAIVVLASRFALSSAIPMRLVLLLSASDLFGLSFITVSGLAFQAFDRLRWTAGFSVLTSAGRCLGAAALVRSYVHPTSLQWGYVYGLSTAAVATFAVFTVCLKLGAPKLSWPSSLKEIREGLYYSVGLGAQTIYNDIDKTMLTRLGTLEAAGIYGAAYRIIDVCFVPVTSLLVASYTNFFRAGTQGIRACFDYARPILCRALSYPLFSCAALISMAGLIPRILGSDYTQAAEALRWLALLPTFKLSSYVFSNVLTSSGYQGVRSSVQVSVAVANVMLNLWIIPRYSWRGAAWSSLASDALLALSTGVAVFTLARREKAVLLKVDANAMA
jgi:O-antigen/teichoic acid export membrane protein